MAEVLQVYEQELFRFDIECAIECNLRYSKEAREILELLQFALKPLLEQIRRTLQHFASQYEAAKEKLNLN